MDEQLKGFLADLVKIIQGKYNETLIEAENESEQDKSYRLGLNFGYYDVLDLIESQLKAFSYDSKEIGEITPLLGRKI